LSLCSKSTRGGCGVSESHQMTATSAQPIAMESVLRVMRNYGVRSTFPSRGFAFAPDKWGQINISFRRLCFAPPAEMLI